jgi:hypothetical protein
MLDRHRHRFLFIHIPKVAGMSINAALGAALYGPARRFLHALAISVGREMRWRLICLRGHSGGLRSWERAKKKAGGLFGLLNIYPPHLTARAWSQKLAPDLFDSLFKFAFIRNPWDWQVSLYHYILQDQKHPQHALLKSLGSFSQYLRWRVTEPLETQKSYITDLDGRVLVNFVGRFERLTEDFQHVGQVLNLKHMHLPHINASVHRPYQSYYDGPTCRLVEEYFQEDIETFGYTFDAQTEPQLDPANRLLYAGRHTEAPRAAA